MSEAVGAPALLPVFHFSGNSAGPTLCLLAGVHGCEYTAMHALRRAAARIDESCLAGRVVVLPLVNVRAFQERRPFLTPDDGKNLNRCFPGDPAGTYSERLARLVFDRFIAPSDYLVDLHSGDLPEALEPFTLYDESAVTDRSTAMAEAFGLPVAICPRRAERIEGTTIAAAADLSIPALTAEAGGQGTVDERSADLLSDGVDRVLRHLGMVPAGHGTRAGAIRTFRRFRWLYSPAEGWWTAERRVGDWLEAGDRLGVITDLLGDDVGHVLAPESGVVVFLTINPSVAAEGVLVGLGTEPL